MSTKNFALLALTFFLASCVSIQSYPTGWAHLSQASTGACPQVSGTFLNRGEGGGPHGQKNLALQLFSTSASWTRADRVFIQMPNSNTLSIRALSGDSVLNESTLIREKKEFSCEGGFLAIRKGLSGFGEGGGLGASNETVFLALSEDGFLVVKEVSSGIGVVVIIPVAGSITTWTRYQPAK